MSYLIPTKKNVKTITDMRENAVGLLNAVKDEGPQYVFHHSEPKAVLLSNEEYQALLERIEDLEDSLLAQQLEHEPYKPEDYLSEAEVIKNLGLSQ